jgi:histidinol-phosphate/aromatic aminotransferase/cobyric acid decarboxylase-like protein
MQALARKTTPAEERGLPLNLGLNDGTYCPASCVEVLERYRSRTALRNYSTAQNEGLRERIARVDGVDPDNVYLANGSGPLLKQGIPHLLKKQIRSSLGRTFHYLLTRGGYPVFTTHLTYSKVPAGLEKMRIPVRFLRVEPENRFRLDLALLRRGLEKEDGLVYLVNPNNPTGNVLFSVAELEPLVAAYPRSTFWIDEAYVHYVAPERVGSLPPLVRRYPNLVVSRSFSFAYGMAAARIGYLLGTPSLIAELEQGVTPYRLGGLQEDLAIAALADENHLPFIRRETANARRAILDGLRGLPAIELWDSETNFLLGRRRDGRPATVLAEALERQGVRIKTFTPHHGMTFDEYFRITVGLSHENERLVSICQTLLAGAGPRA